jgi:RNA polymerase sigma-70 factor (ECF subfamily)
MATTKQETVMRIGRSAPATSSAFSAEEADDAELVRRSQARPADFSALYLRYRDRVIRYCLFRLGEYAEAEDAASAIFVKALAGLCTFREGGNSFRSWLFRIAHNEIVDRHKRAGLHPEVALDAAAEAVDLNESPEDAAVAADGLNRLRNVLATLPPRERSVIELRLADLSTDEIQSVLGISEGSIWTAQSRGLAKIRDAMESEAGAHG